MLKKIVFFSEHFQKSFCSGVFSPAVNFTILVKRKPQFIRFSGPFPKFSVQLFQKTLAVDYRPVFWLEVSSPKTNS